MRTSVFLRERRNEWERESYFSSLNVTLPTFSFFLLKTVLCVSSSPLLNQCRNWHREVLITRPREQWKNSNSDLPGSEARGLELACIFPVRWCWCDDIGDGDGDNIGGQKLMNWTAESLCSHGSRDRNKTMLTTNTRGTCNTRLQENRNRWKQPAHPGIPGEKPSWPWSCRQFNQLQISFVSWFKSQLSSFGKM